LYSTHLVRYQEPLIAAGVLEEEQNKAIFINLEVLLKIHLGLLET
jgi:hypothetical protein